MAQLKDTVLSGSLRVTDTTYTTTADVTVIKAPTSSGSTAHGVGASGNVLHSNGTASYWSPVTSGELPSHTHPYLPTSGGTMTGTLTAKGSAYSDNYTGALNMNNSNIYGVNSIYTADASDTAGEGIHFYRDSTHVDTLWMNGGDLLFVPNRLLAGDSGTTATKAESEKVARLPKTITTGQLVVTDTTGGLLKTTAASAITVGSASYATNASQLGGSAASTYLQGDDVKAGSGITVSTAAGVATVSADLRTTTKLGAAGATAAATETTKIYAVQMDSNGDLAVKVPWTDSQDIPITGAEKGLSVTSKKVGHATTITAGNVGPDGNKSPSHGGTFVVPYIAYDAYGHSTAVANRTITLPNDSDTKNTAGSTNSDSKLFLIGATSQAANPQTYSDSEVYTTNGTLTTNKVQVGGTAVTLQFNSTTKSLDFVFA